MKKRFALPFVLCLAALPLQAEEVAPDVDQGFSLIEEGAKILMGRMLNEMRPKLEEFQIGLGQALSEMEPALRDLAAMIDDIRNYDPPVMMPNGDIVIRRRTDVPQMTPRPGDEIDL